MKFEIKKRWTNEVAFIAEIDATEATPHGEKMCMAVKWAMAAGIALSGLILDGGIYKNCRFVGSRFEDSSFVGSRFVRSRFEDSSFVGSRFVGSRFEDSSFVRSSFVGSRFVDSRFVRSSFEDSRFVDSSFVRSRFEDSRFVDSSFDSYTLKPFKSDLWMTLTINKTEASALLTAMKEGRIDGSQYEGECSCLKGTIAAAKHVDYRTLSPNSSDPAECWFMNISKGNTPENNYFSKLAVEWVEEWCVLNGIEFPVDATPVVTP